MRVPSSHRRIGLVVDESVNEVLNIFRESSPAPMPDATIARKAVLEGALVEMMFKLAGGHAHESELAAEIVARIRELVPSLDLTGEAKDEITELLDRTASRESRDERRLRQRALLHQPVGESGQTAQDIADTFDAFERLPVR